jgi:DNA-binding NtrC family response regulator
MTSNPHPLSASGPPSSDRGDAGDRPGPRPQPALTTEFITEDPRTLEVLQLLGQVADTDVTVLITGESGTGKDLLARAIHEASSRRNRPYVAVNCGAIPHALAESEIFGHVRGAFTGAEQRRQGRFEVADGGTIFLDEISEMRRRLQVHLLRILQSGEYTPVGTSVTQTCDVRVISAANRDLTALVARGAFRRDLYHRLNIIAVEIPPLRERLGDVPPLACHFLHRFAVHYGKPEITAEPSFFAALAKLDYPGNARELENLVRRAVLLCTGSRITAGDLAGVASPTRIMAPSETPLPFHQAKASVIECFERRYLEAALAWSGGVISRAARSCGLSERNFHAKLKAYGLAGRGRRPDPDGHMREC